MKYIQNYTVDENMRVIRCPKCSNEVFSVDAIFCKLCGTKLYNTCAGDEEYDDYGNVIDRHFHNNPGDARFCETCSKPTVFFESGFLKSWEEEKQEIEELIEMGAVDPNDVYGSSTNYEPEYDDVDDDDDIPF